MGSGFNTVRLDAKSVRAEFVETLPPVRPDPSTGSGRTVKRTVLDPSRYTQVRNSL